MIGMIRNILEEEKIALWRVTESREHCAELYFIRKKLDMPRMRDNARFAVTVLRDFEADGKKCRGSSTALIAPGTGKEEARAKIRAAYAAAAYVKNPYFELADAVKEEEKPSRSALAGAAPEENAVRLARIMLDADRDEDAFLNSVEIFASHVYKRVITSHGTDVSWQADRLKGELVAQCVSPTDVEQYRSFGWDCIDEEQIREKVAEAIASVRDRARASGLPKTGKYPVIIRGDNLRELLGYYSERADAEMVASGYSDWKVGDVIQQAEDGEKLLLTAASFEPYSSEGIPMPDRVFVKDGILCMIHGDTRFCRYAGTEPVGRYDRLICENGSKALSELRAEGVLEPVSFSDFQMDTFDGHFKGEIRLAYLYGPDGEKRILTGGSVNGSLSGLQGHMVFSKERYVSLDYDGPWAVRIPGVSVAGK